MTMDEASDRLEAVADELAKEGWNVVAVMSRYERSDSHFSTIFKVQENAAADMSKNDVVSDAVAEIQNEWNWGLPVADKE